MRAFNHTNRTIIYVCLSIAMLAVIFFNVYRIGREKNIEVFDYFDKKTSIKVANPIISLGELKINSKVEANFKVFNIGENLLFIKSVKPDCHCTIAAYSKKPIQPGDSTLINVKYDSTIPGFFQKKITVEINSQESPIMLIFRGEISN